MSEDDSPIGIRTVFAAIATSSDFFARIPLRNSIFVGMKETIDLFADLGQRLRIFGKDPRSHHVVEAACAANEWFSPEEIRRAVSALADEMLSRDKLAAWLAHYPALPTRMPKNVLVVMAGNIPLVGFFDLLCTLVSGHRCLVKPSSKDSVLMEYVVGQLLDGDPSLPVTQYDGTSAVDAVIATGSDNAVRYFRSHYAGIPALLRGSRQSVAVLTGEETPRQLAGLSDDIWSYSGLGCRNVSLLFVPDGYEPQLKVTAVNNKYKNNYMQQKALLSMQGRAFVDLDGAVLVEQDVFPEALSRIAYIRYRSLEEVAEWLRLHDGELQCVVSESLPHSRQVGFGRSQHPGLTDYPDDRDVMEWLSTI